MISEKREEARGGLRWGCSCDESVHGCDCVCGFKRYTEEASYGISRTKYGSMGNDGTVIAFERLRVAVTTCYRRPSFTGNFHSIHSSLYHHNLNKQVNSRID
jgi:hypothetical protein